MNGWIVAAAVLVGFICGIAIAVWFVASVVTETVFPCYSEEENEEQ